MIQTLKTLVMTGVFLLIHSAAFAQTPEISVEFDDAPVIVGQPFILRLTVLVPTHMPKPPIFPTYEAPNIIIRLPEKSSTPTSKTVNGETWSGITRAYRFYPMEAGTTVIPPQDVTLFYVNETNVSEVETYTSQTPEVSIVATLPDKAKDLNPPILATGLSITQTLVPQEGPVEVGGSIERKLSIKIDGTSALFIPPLIKTEPIAGLAAYPKDPKVAETSNRGLMSGTREESVVYVAQTAGPLVLPEISLDWYNVETDTVETLSLPGITSEITQPNVVVQSLNQNLYGTIAAAIVGLLGIWLLWTRILHSRFKWLKLALEANYNKSRSAAYKRAQVAAQSRDLVSLFSALESVPTLSSLVSTDLLQLTGSLFGPAAGKNKSLDASWLKIEKTIAKARPRVTLRELVGKKAVQTFTVGDGLGNQRPKAN